MLFAAMLVHADHAAFEDAEIAFDRVCRDLPAPLIRANVFLGTVIDGFVPPYEFVSNAVIGSPVVRHDPGRLIDTLADRRF